MPLTIRHRPGYVVYPDTRSGEEVAAMRVVPREA
jgi:hypothetical protein